jgi:small subunit ribosomal protein S18
MRRDGKMTDFRSETRDRHERHRNNSQSRNDSIDYKDVRTIAKYLSERGKIIPSRINSLSMKQQREVSKAIKRARILALIPFINR